MRSRPVRKCKWVLQQRLRVPILLQPWAIGMRRRRRNFRIDRDGRLGGIDLRRRQYVDLHLFPIYDQHVRVRLGLRLCLYDAGYCDVCVSRKLSGAIRLQSGYGWNLFVSVICLVHAESVKWTATLQISSALAASSTSEQLAAILPGGKTASRETAAMPARSCTSCLPVSASATGSVRQGAHI